MTGDPFAVLGLDRRSASAGDVLAARRRLAKQLHPDLGGDQQAMQAVNAAVAAALAALGALGAADAEPATRRPAALVPGAGWSRRVAHDTASFTIEALPAEAFEALLVVTSWIGEVLVDDPPYLLETHLHDPVECWCRLDVVPDAGASTVSLTVALPDGAATVGELPDLDAVRDEWVANLNRLDWDQLGRGPLPPS